MNGGRMKTWRFSSAGIAVTAITLAVFVRVQAEPAVDVLTQHNDNARTGATLTRPSSTPATSARDVSASCGRSMPTGRSWRSRCTSRRCAIDTTGNPNAPLVQGTFNAVIIATMHNTVYVYDADKEKRGPEGRTVPLWATWLGPPRPGGKDIDMWSTNDPEWGILSTPVISADKTTLFVVAWHNDGAEGCDTAARAQPAERHASTAAGRHRRRLDRSVEAVPAARAPSTRARTSSGRRCC